MSRQGNARFTFALALLLALSTSRVFSQGLDKLDTSLKWIPADAPSYRVFLRNREQFQAVARSKAWSKIAHLPSFQEAAKELPKGYVEEPTLAAIYAWYQKSENYQLVHMVLDLLGTEVFFYSGMCPTDHVIGFKVRDIGAVQRQLKRLEKSWLALARQFRQENARLSTSVVAGVRYLTFELQDPLILQETPTSKTWIDGPMGTIRVGLRKDYLLLAFGNSIPLLESFERRPALADREELRPLARFADRPLTYVSYDSKEFRSKGTINSKDLDAGLAQLTDLFSLCGVGPKLQKKIRKDLKALAKDLKKMPPHQNLWANSGWGNAPRR